MTTPPSNTPLDVYLAELDQTRTAIGPYQEFRIEAYKASIQFAMAGLRSLIVLNGGALIALPAFHNLVAGAGRNDWSTLPQILIAFAAGLALCVAAFLFGYMAAGKGAGLAVMQMEYVQASIRAQFERLANPSAPRPSATDQDLAERRARCRARSFEIAAVLAAILSLLCFLLGAFLAYRLFGA